MESFRITVAALALLAAGCGVTVATPCVPDGGGDMAGCYTPAPAPDLWHNTSPDSCEAQLLCEFDDSQPNGMQCPFINPLKQGNYEKLRTCAKDQQCKDPCADPLGIHTLSKECKACIRLHAADGVFHYACNFCE